uniref:Titin-like n=1 Tax=Scleropages formosus TaxID=113540 RepID=A0A8D0CMM4_SCLFO
MITGYIVEKRDIPEGRWIKANFTNIIETHFTITGLIENCKYDFRIIAKNAVGTISKPSCNTGPITAKDEAEPPRCSTDPEYIQAIVVNAGESFKLEADVYGRPMPTIQWFKDDKEIENSSRCEIKNTESRTMVENLAEGAMYYFRVMAENEYGVSQPIETKSAVRVCEVPLSVRNVTLTDVTKVSASLAWEKPEHDGGSRIMGYAIEMQVKGTDKWTVATSTKTCEGTVAGLISGQEYLFRVLAYNEKGKSDPKILATPVTANDLTVEPSFKLLFNTYSVKSGDDLKIEIMVTGCPKPKITWMKDGLSLKQTTRINPINTPTSTILQIKEACKDDFGKYSVTATNCAGDSKEEIVIIVFDKPGPPTGPIQINDVTNNSVTVSWEPPEYKECFIARDPCDSPGTPEPVIICRNHVTLQWMKPQYDGGSKVTGYIIEKRDLPEGRWMKANFTNVAETEFTVTGLSEGEKYEFRIIARNAAGIFSQPSESTGPIADVVVINAGCTLALDANVYGKPEPDVIWLKDGKKFEVTTQKVDIKTTSKSTVLIVKDCTREDSGCYNLILSNIGGTKTIPITVKVLDRPGSPEGPLQVTEVTADACCLSWGEPLQDGGAAVDHYIVEKRDTSKLSWTVVKPKVKALSCKVTNLLVGNEYIFRTMAVNKYGISEPLESEPVTAKHPFKPPSPPSMPEATCITGDSMVIKWEQPEYNGGSDIHNYHLEKRDKDGVRWTKCNKTELSDLNFKVTGLTEGHFYEFRVSAENEAGVGPPSEPSLFYRACNVTDHTSSTVTLSWSKPLDDGGAYIKGYIVEMKEVTHEDWSTCTPSTGIQATQYKVEKLKENTKYNFRICAFNAEGVGEHADIHGSIAAVEKQEVPEAELDAELRKVVSVRASGTLR